uniref:SWI/SNF-related matrix-associated actin-dependent regulator of chromatin subfamily A containing DEAD/H box 1 homolog n=1 Tax=Cacopsylla melanoneura TaxID=428564 RepID=A0A8D8RAS3_9HEMI
MSKPPSLLKNLRGFRFTKKPGMGLDESPIVVSDDETPSPVNGVTSSTSSVSQEPQEESVSSLIGNSIKEQYEIEEIGLDDLLRPNSNAYANLVRVTEDSVVSTTDSEPIQVNVYKLETLEATPASSTTSIGVASTAAAAAGNDDDSNEVRYIRDLSDSTNSNSNSNIIKVLPADCSVQNSGLVQFSSAQVTRTTTPSSTPAPVRPNSSAGLHTLRLPGTGGLLTGPRTLASGQVIRQLPRATLNRAPPTPSPSPQRTLGSHLVNIRHNAPRPLAHNVTPRPSSYYSPNSSTDFIKKTLSTTTPAAATPPKPTSESSDASPIRKMPGKRPVNRLITSEDEEDGLNVLEAPQEEVSSSSAGRQAPGKRRLMGGVQSKVKKRKKASMGDSDSEDDGRYEDKRVFDSDDSENEGGANNYELTGTRKKVLKFLQRGTMTDLKLIPGITQKKVDTIIQLRPYSSWKDVVDKFESSKMLGGSSLNGVSALVSSLDVVSNLMKKCEKLAYKTERTISEGVTYIKKQPSILNNDLKLASYQLVGLNWLAVMHNQQLCGILADEMGLGKTIQVIAFLAYLHEAGLCRPKSPHLIIVPSSTLSNWQNEFELWCPMLRVALYYGAPEERRSIRNDWIKSDFSDMDVILTTYSMVTSCYEERKLFRSRAMHYVVFDEAHMLKNMKTQRYENLITINAAHRILLTGTPLQNNLLELMSLLIFVMPHMFFNRMDTIKMIFGRSNKEQATFEVEQVDQAKRIIGPFMLRRLKKDVLTELPKKTASVIKVPMTPSQAEKYRQLVDDFKKTANPEGSSRSNEVSYMSMFMMLRKIANHPLGLRYHFQEDALREIADCLVEDPTYKGTNPQYILEDISWLSDYDIHQLSIKHKTLDVSKYKVPDELVVESGKLKKLDEILPDLKKNGHRVLIFSQFIFVLDILGHYLDIRGYRHLRLDGSTQVSSRQELIDEYNRDEDLFAFLLSTKAGGLGINLTAADTVIIHDVDFNPYNDKQAEDRCHRVGQTKPVTIMRLITEGTVEENIYKVALEKLNLEKEVTSKDNDDEEESRNIEQLLHEALGIS